MYHIMTALLGFGVLSIGLSLVNFVGYAMKADKDHRLVIGFMTLWVIGIVIACCYGLGRLVLSLGAL